jgi:hypothetical protein
MAITVTATTQTRSMLRAVSADLIRWAPVGPFGSRGFVRSDGRRYRTTHLSTLIVLWQAKIDGLITACDDTGHVTLTRAGWDTLAEKARP